MATQQRDPSDHIAVLLREIVADGQQLVSEQLRLLRGEFKEEGEKAQRAAVAIGIGAGLTAAGGILGTLAAARFVHSVTGIPLWACYGGLGAALGAAGVQFLAAGAHEARQIEVLPHATETMRENAEAAQRALSPGRA